MNSPSPAAIDGDVELERAPLRAWLICGLLLLATMLMYMDRQALAQQQKEILTDLHLSKEDYGNLEKGFGLAFAAGGIVTGILADRVGPRWLYPLVLIGWSSVGFATGWASSFRELLVCRILLGFFEAGHWPCALLASQRLLTSRDRALGNSILQSGASLGAIATPIVVLLLTTQAPESWRLPFFVIGGLGAIWVLGWVAVIRPGDFAVDRTAGHSTTREPDLSDHDVPLATQSSARATWISRLLALIVVVITINLCWQYFRAWMPGMLREQYGYSKEDVQYFSIAYYITTDVGCLSIGFLVKWLADRGLTVHKSRMLAFFGCCLLTTIAIPASMIPASPLLLGLLLLVGFGSLGQFPVYYALSQELSTRYMGRVTGLLSFMTWTATGFVQPWIGSYIDQTHTYTATTLISGAVPMLGFFALICLWHPASDKPASVQASAGSV